MVYMHEVWLNGTTEPQRFRLESEDLFLAYQRWVRGEPTGAERGFVFTSTDKEVTRTVALSFAAVSCMAVEKRDEDNERRSMGFLRSS